MDPSWDISTTPSTTIPRPDDEVLPSSPAFHRMWRMRKNILQNGHHKKKKHDGSMGRTVYSAIHEWLDFYSKLVGKYTSPMDPSWEMKTGCFENHLTKADIFFRGCFLPAFCTTKKPMVNQGFFTLDWS